MILTEPQDTSFDLRFRIFGVPVRVSPWFWAIFAMLGWGASEGRIESLLVWIGCGFVSILIHELGHVMMGRLFGSDGHIVLYGFGGLAIGASALAQRWQRVAVYFAGPLAQFILLGGVLLAGRYLVAPEPHLLVREAMWDLFQINFFWPILNLMPIWPLDGGQVSRELFDWWMPRRGTRVSLIISMIVGLLLALGAIYLTRGRSIYMPLMFALLALGSFQAFQQLQAQDQWTDDHWHDPDRHRDRRDR